MELINLIPNYTLICFYSLLICNIICTITIFSFHLDHSGALPWFLTKTSFKGRVFMTHATKAIYRWLVSDYIKVRYGMEKLKVSYYTQ